MNPSGTTSNHNYSEMEMNHLLPGKLVVKEIKERKKKGWSEGRSKQVRREVRTNVTIISMSQGFVAISTMVNVHNINFRVQ